MPIENQSRILAALRVHNHLSQAYVAKKLQLSQGQYSKIESGMKELPLSKLPALAAVFTIKPVAMLECLLIGIEKPDDAIRKLVNEMNNRQEHKIAIKKQELKYKILAEYWEKKYFSLYRELNLYERSGIERHQKNPGEF